MTRPKSDQASRKSRVVSFRLTETQFARLAYKAAAANVRVNDLARQLTLSGQGRLSIAVDERSDPALIKQLHHIGHNLNQLVKNAHIFGRVSPKVNELCDQIGQIVHHAVEKELKR